MHYIYTTFVYNPLYNGLVFLMEKIPFLDVGIIIIIFTVLVKLILFPLSKKAVHTQATMKLVEPELNAIKEKYKDNRQEQSLQILKLYREKNINPFSSIFLLLIQLPIIFALYKIFYSGGFSTINSDILYSFVHIPQSINVYFLGLIDMTEKSAVMAVIAAISQFFQIKFSVPAPTPKTGKEGFQEDFVRNMQTQMKYVFPVMILFISYHAMAALALYWTVSNIFMIGQEIVVRRQIAKKQYIP